MNVPILSSNYESDVEYNNTFMKGQISLRFIVYFRKPRKTMKEIICNHFNYLRYNRILKVQQYTYINHFWINLLFHCEFQFSNAMIYL